MTIHLSIDTAAIDPEILADTEAVIAAITAGKKPDDELVHRIQTRSDQIRERVFREHGFVMRVSFRHYRYTTRTRSIG